ncbi:MAG: thioester reductase domain-containing protein [Devosia sp.]
MNTMPLSTPRIDATSSLPKGGDLAVIGCGLRLPGNLHSLDDLWDFLIRGGDGIRDLPEGRWANDLYDPRPRPGRTYVKRAGYVDGLELIDPSFLGCSPREATQIDPQQRLLIETAFEALENAGEPLNKLSKSRTGVFVGISSNDYIQAMNDDARRGNAYTNSGGALSIAANRISYVFDLRGPSLAIDTACSSGLTAFDVAVRSLRQGACEVAIVGAANALFRPEPFVGFCQATMLSPAAQCRAFDADGQGFVRAEGAVSFILKPLVAAKRDRNPILGVIRGSDSNNDGRTGGLSLPSGEAQAELIERVFREHGINASDVAYVEAHGTGTAAGDPIEAGAIGRAIAQHRKGDDQLLIGSIKSNIGHLEPASGLAGLAKALLCLNHRVVPKSLHFETPNPAIDFDGLRIKVAADVAPLPETDGPTLVCVNSFGFGGANAHVVVAEPPQPVLQAPKEAALARPWLMVSSRSSDALRSAAADLSRHIDRKRASVCLEDLCGNLLTRRTWHPHRAAIFAETLEDVQRELKALAADEASENVVSGTALHDARTAFVFTGNGPQWWAMGRELYAASNTFRTAIEEIDATFANVSGLKLIDEMMKSEADSGMERTEIAQPALFGVQVGLVRCLAEDGVLPEAAVGHSAGELAAAYCAGLFDLHTIVRIVSARSEQQGKTAGAGAMAAIGLAVEPAAQFIANYDGLVIAGDNGPEAVSVAGPVASIDALVARLKENGVFATKLRLNYAFHSPAMDPIESDFRALVSDVVGKKGTIPFYSTVSGALSDGSAMDADYWWRNLRDPVMFRPAIANMCNDGFGVFVEVGPHPNLLGYVKAIGRESGTSVRLVETLKRDTDEVRQRRKATAAAAVAGASLDFTAQFPEPVPVMPLPTYPWQREHQFNRPQPRASVPALATGHKLLGSRISLAKDVWHQDIALSRMPFIADHVIRDTVLFPAAGFFEVAVAAGRSSGLEETVELRAVRIEKAFALDHEREALLQTFFDRTDHSLSIRSRTIGNTTDHASDGETEPFTEHMRAVLEHRPRGKERVVDQDAIRAGLSRGVRSQDEHYAMTAARGLNYGPDFRTVDALHMGEGEVLVELTRRTEAGAAFNLDPTVVDGALQAMIGLIDRSGDKRLFVPVQLDRLIVEGSTREHESVFAHVVARGANHFYLSADIVLFAPDGTIIAELLGMQVRSVGAGGADETLLLSHSLKPLRSFGTALDANDPAALLVDAPLSPRAQTRRRIMARYDTELEMLTATFTASTFHTLTGGTPFTVERLVADGAVAETQARYANAVLSHAVSRGTVLRESDTTLRTPTPQDPRGMLQTCLRQYPAYSAELFLTARIWTHHAALLSGEQSVLDILFPRAGSPAMEQIYDQGFTSLEANEAIANAIARHVERLGLSRPVKILEVGGGTGGTTTHILNAVDTSRVDYLFTDISPDFLGGAERRFSAVPGFRTGLLDLSEGAQVDVLGGPFDIIVGANVVHATPDVRKSLSTLRSLLRDNGILGLVEIEPHGYFDFVFGLLPDLWTFTDNNDRTDNALIRGEHWREILSAEGFADVALWSDASNHAPAACSVLLGRKAEGAIEIATHGAAEDAEEASGDAGEFWLLVDCGTNSDFTDGLADKVCAGGDTVSRVRVRSENTADDETVIAADDAAAWESLCRDVSSAPPARIVVVAPKTSPADVPCDDEGWPLVALLKAANAADWSAAPRLDIVTENVLTETDANLAGGCYWAVGRTIVNEQSNWHCRRADWDGSAAACERLYDWLTGAPGSTVGIGDNVDELRFTEDGIFANVVGPVPDGSGVPGKDEDVAFAVTLKAQGSIDNLVLRRLTPAPNPAKGMVEVAMKSAGLNFKDVILALGMLPPELLKDSEAGPLMGLEGAGIVSRVGPEVTNLAVGDRVMLMAEGCFASHVTLPEHAVQPMPDEWSFDEAATLPVVGLTVVYALDIVARLKPGETILVHGGAGGIGLMAIQYAKSIGAKIIATAGSPEKRDILSLLGVDCISDSRTLRFEEDVWAFTEGKGVDVVLNSLAGDAMLASLELLKPFGRFVEIGKRDFEQNSRVSLKLLEDNISYFAVDLTFLPHQRPDLFVEAWDRLLAACQSGAIRPLAYRTYRLTNLTDALRLMQGGRHVGKLVLDLDRKNAPIEPLPKGPSAISSDGVHLITGGLGGIGLKIALWMAERGATKIALVGRKGVTTEAQAKDIAQVEAAGAQVLVIKADVSDAEQVSELIADLEASEGEIRGIMHAVLVLDDSLMTNMTHEAFQKVMRPKVLGAQYLHEGTKGKSLDYFVVFSSLANVLGNPGQSNYVAANAYLEQLILARRGRGLPGLALELGAVADAGVLERDAELRANVNKTIGGAITVAGILDTLDANLESGPAVTAVINASGRFVGPIMQTARAEALAGQIDDQQGASGERIDFNAVPSDERLGLMEKVLIQAIAKALGAKESRIDPERSLSEAGLDSLMAVEFAMAVEQKIGISIPPSELTKDRSLRELAGALLVSLNVEVTAGEDESNAEAMSEADLMQADATLCDDFVVERPAPEVPVRERSAILLTGATGFLGAFILNELIEKGARRIICLGRGRDNAHARERILQTLQKSNLPAAAAQVGDRIEVIAGDLVGEGFGLSKDEMARLSEDVDLVIHNAADVNFLSSYEEMRTTNVKSVQQFLEFCRTGRPKAFQFVSTLRIFVRLDQIEESDINEGVAPWLPPEDEGGYVKTKWVADTLVREARDRGLTAGIYRPSFVIGRTTDGFSNVSDLGSALARFALDTGMLPNVEVALPVIPVDIAARRIVAFIDTPGAQSANYHITDWPALSMEDIRHISEENGAAVELLPVDTFVEKALDFFEANPGHPAIWLPVFFASGAANNTLGSKLSAPVLPVDDDGAAGAGRATLGRMVHWFREETRASQKARSPARTLESTGQE